MDPTDLIVELDVEPDPEPEPALATGTKPPVFAKGTRESVAQLESADLIDLETRLDRCLANLSMHYQPIVRAVDRVRYGYEALLRSTDRSLPHPGAILDAAE